MASANVITKVALPRELIPASAIVALGVSLGIELSVLALVQAVTGHVMVHLVPVAALLIAVLAVFVVGLGLWLSALNIRYRDVRHLTSVLLTVCFHLTPIPYSPSMIPERSAIWGLDVPTRAIALGNPMARFVIAFRDVFYDFRVRSPYFVEDL